RMWNWSSQSWHATEVVSELTFDSNNPAMAVDVDGNVFVTWHDLAPWVGSGPDLDIFFRYRSVTSGIWDGFTNTTDVVSTDSNLDSKYPSIAVDDDLTVHICWIDYSDIYGAGTDADVFYKYTSRTIQAWRGRVNSTDIISSESSRDSVAASIVTGSVNVVWQDKTHFGFGTDWDIFYKNLLIFEAEGPEDEDGFELWIIIIIVIAAVAGVASLFVFRMRSKSRVKGMPVLKFNKAAMGEVRSALKEVIPVEEKVVVLQRNNFPIELISELYDGNLTDFFSQTFTTVPIQLIEFLQKVDAPLEEKLEILEEFNNLSDEQKEEFLKELTEL
ncbi:MAG: hypothetical protein HWN66_11835, partial [Candidatus Helarchaeota archaeon]|nr:hypothetical protein [Candidatus Helarchaeota archaeon]